MLQSGDGTDRNGLILARSAAMFNRLSLTLKAKFSRLLDRAESPAEILDYSYEQQLEQLYGMRRDVADLVTAKQRVMHHRDRRRARFASSIWVLAKRSSSAGRTSPARRSSASGWSVRNSSSSIRSSPTWNVSRPR